MKTYNYTITPTATTGRIRLSDTAKTIISFITIFILYATVDGLADVFFGGVL